MRTRVETEMVKSEKTTSPDERIAGRAGSVVVVLLNWNGWKDTARCLASVYAQGYEPYEVVVVDNGSTDGSAHKLRETYAGLQVIENGKNLGFAAGCNVAIRRALTEDFEFVWLLNNDAIADESCLQEMVREMQENPSVGVVGAVVKDLDDSGRVLAWGGGRIDRLFGRGVHVTRPGYVDYITGASMLLRGAALRQCGLLDERFFMYWEDVDICLRLREAGYGVAVAEGADVWHAESSSFAKIESAKTRYMNASSARFILKHMSWPFARLMLIGPARVGRRLMLLRLRDAAAVLRGLAEGLFGNHRTS